MEFGEYCQAFLSGRNFQSELNSIFTLSGAFSAFRKSAIMKTQLYNTDTLCEDTHVTFQVRFQMKKRVALCPNAIFFEDPIDNPFSFSVCMIFPLPLFYFPVYQKSGIK